MAFEAVREKFPGSTVERTVTEGAGQRGSKGHFAVLCVGDWERICAGGSKAEPSGMLCCLVKQRNLKVQIQSAPRKRFLKETKYFKVSSIYLFFFVFKY